MTHNHQWRKAVAWEGEDPPSGFERTLSPSDPRVRSKVPFAGYIVRDNRQGQVFRGPEAAAVSSPTSVTPVSGVVRSRDRVSVDAADTLRDVMPLPYEEPLEITPDFASEYMPPQPLPRVAQHKTFELRPVRLDPQIHPRTAPTELNLRTVRRRQEKQQKDAEELAALIAQAERRRRGPWVFVGFLVVVAAGFLIGAKMVDSAEAEAETRVGVAQPKAAQGHGVEDTNNTVKPNPSAPLAQSVESAPAAGSPQPMLREGAASSEAPIRKAAESPSAARHRSSLQAAGQSDAPSRVRQPVARRADGSAPPLKTVARPGRDVWLR